MTSPTQNRIPLSAPHMGVEELPFIQNAFAENMIAMGSHLPAFEHDMAQRIGVQHAVAVASGTAALHLALIGLGIKRGDEVWCASLTFCASANPITYVGATPVFIDSERLTWNMDPDLLAQALDDAAKIGRLPKAVIVVDLYGQCANYVAICAHCARYDVPLIEDAAEALGAHYKKRAAGSFGRCSIVSFNGNKIITTGGGGMLLTNDQHIATTARHLSSQARDPAPWYEHTQIGFNYRLSNISAGIGRGQLQVLDQRVAARRAIFQRYHQQLATVPGLSFAPDLDDDKGTNCTRWLTVMQIDPALITMSPLAVMDVLNTHNIESRPVWKPMHLQPIFVNTKAIGGTVAEELFNRGICIPSSSTLTEEDQTRVIAAIKSAIKNN